MLTVVKVGGRIAGDPALLDAVARGIAGLEGPAVVVHGGGSAVSRWFRRVDLPVTWRDGLRVTTDEGIELTSMVLSGWVNKRIVGALLDAGADAVGVAGEDGGLVEAEALDGGALGRVGEPVRVRRELLLRLVAADIVPVVSPVSRGGDGAPLNVNADEVAVAVARALPARSLLLVSDVEGVRVGESIVETVLPGDGADLLAGDGVTGGMRVKLSRALEAAAAGIEVRIGGRAILADAGAGTRVAGAGSGEGAGIAAGAGEPRRAREAG